MTEGDKNLITRKNDEVQRVIKEQHRLPKGKRNERLLNEARQKAARYKRWLKD